MTDLSEETFEGLSTEEIIELLNTRGVLAYYESVALVCATTGEVLAVDLGGEPQLMEASVKDDGSISFDPEGGGDGVTRH